MRSLPAPDDTEPDFFEAPTEARSSDIDCSRSLFNLPSTPQIFLQPSPNNMVSSNMTNSRDLIHIQKQQANMATNDNLPLPMEALALKESLLHTHHHKSLAMHTKSFAFTLFHLRKMVVPPVQIPRNYKKMRTLRVSGVDVPFTRKQFERRKKEEMPRLYRLKTIRE